MNPYGGPHVLIRHLRENTSLTFRKWPIIFFFLWKSTFSFPFSLMEKWMLGSKIRNTPLPADPVFILGHYRSGTTLLHKLLDSDPRFSTINTFDLIFPNCPNWLQPPLKTILQGVINLFHIKQKFFHNYVVNLDDPNEEEPVLLSTCSRWTAYWGYIFPKRAVEYLDRYISFHNQKEREDWQKAFDYYIRKFTRRKGNRQLVLKDPPHTGRIAALLELYPNAKFIHVYRNPYRVYYSMQKLWRETIESHYTTQQLSNAERDEIIFEHYGRLMRNFEAQKCLIPAGNLVEIKYEKFKIDPVGELQNIYRSLQLPEFKEGLPAIELQLSKEQSYRTFDHKFDTKVLDKIESEWQPFIKLWGYQRPSVSD
jgi:hypothetical protein